MMRSPAWAQTWTALRFIVALLLLSAVVTQAASTFGAAIDEGRDVATTVANFFSFFTILSNVLALIVLAWGAIWFWTRGKDAVAEPRTLAIALASATTYMIVTGVVYNILLRGIALPGAAVPWTNEVLHVVGPLFLLLDLFLGPRPRGMRWRALWVVLGFPVAWVVYTLVRGPLVTNPISGAPYWYPYPFLNPHGFSNGYLGVAIYVVVIAVVIAAVGTGVVWVGRRRGRPAVA